MQPKATKYFVLLKLKNLTMPMSTIWDLTAKTTYNQKHIDGVLALDLVDVEAIKKANFRGSD